MSTTAKITVEQQIRSWMSQAHFRAQYKTQNWFEFYESSFALFEQMALRKVRSNLDRLFDKSLTDLIRGIRNNKDNEARYIASCIEEIKIELRQDSIYIKANAIEKLAYLQMLGYDISWASFNIIEVMASTKYTEKRIGYLAAAQSFHDDTDVLMLTTNLIRKDLNSSNMYESGVALGGLSCFITPDLARDLAADVVNLLSSSRPYTRKRAVLLLYKVFLKYPDALRPTFPRLKEKLEDPDPGVQSAAVNVICELARKIPKNYLTLAPVFFKLMTTSSNNWMLIKIIKLFGALVPLEPRLGKKLLEPLTNLINSTSAMSLLYECINTVIAVLISISNNSGADHTASIQLCVQKLGVLIEDSDQNLKYLGLLAMGKILETHPKAVQAHKDIVLRCLDDKDESIRLRSLDLLYGMISKRNIMEIVKKLMEHVESAEGSYYRDELLSRIIGICSYNNYLYITNFEWYISVLVELTKVEGTKHGAKIAEQIQDVTVRVESIRHFAVSQMALLVENANLLLAGSAQQRSNICEVLLAAAWICGEYSQHLQNVHSVLKSMLRAKPSLMPGHILSVYVQNIGKLYSVLLIEAEKEDDWDGVESLDNLMLSKLPEFEVAEHLEAQERACNLMCLLRIVEAIHQRREKIGDEFSTLFEGELNPVNPKAQKSVRIPDGLDLDLWIGDPWEETPEESSDSEIEATFGQPLLRSEFASFGSGPRYESDEEVPQQKDTKKRKSHKPHEPTAEEIEKRKKQREMEIENNPFYVKGTATAPKRPTKFVTMESQNVAEIVDIQSPLEIPGVVGLAKYTERQDSTLTWKRAKEEKVKKVKKGGKKGKKKRNASTSSDEEVNVVHKVNRADGEMPEDARSLDEEVLSEKTAALSDEFKALDVNLDEPLKPEEMIRGPQAYTRVHPATRPTGPLVPRPPTIVDSYNGHGRVITEEPKKTKKVAKKKTIEGEKKKKKASRKAEENGELLTMDQWLDASESSVSVTKAVDTIKTEKKEKKKRQLSPSRDAYEEASGVCTPSNPNVDLSPKLSTAPSGPARLGANSDLTVDYETQVQTTKTDNLQVTLSIKNCGAKLLKNIEVNCIDTLCAKLKRTTENGVKLSGELSPDSGGSLALTFTISGNTMSVQQLRGSLVYFTKDEEGSSDGKLDFRLPLRPTTFVSPSPITKEGYSQLLTGDDVDFSSSIQFPSELPFKELIGRVKHLGHFSVVEEVASAASLHGVFVSDEAICILMKKKGDQVSIDGKSGSQELVDAVVQDLRFVCQR